MSEKRYYGYKTRPPFAGEDSYFKANPGVGGMAAEDDQIVLNPYSKLKPDEMDQVAKNEGLRIYMRQTGGDMDFDLTPEQSAMFQGTAYGDPANSNQAKRTIISRILTGDPSAGIATASQQKWAEGVLAGASANEEKLFQEDYANISKRAGLAADPDEKEHFYDYRSAWRAGDMSTDGELHLPSKYKKAGHPRLYMSPDRREFSNEGKSGWTDTRTGNVEKSGMLKFLGDKKTKLGSYLGGSENKGQSKKNPRLKRRR